MGFGLGLGLGWALGLGIGIIGILLFYYVSVFEKPNETIYNFAYLDKNRNEAIEIARRYCNDEAPTFINGVLDRIASLVGKKVQGYESIE